MVDFTTDRSTTRHDMIIGADTMSELGMNIMCSESTADWGKNGLCGSIPLKTRDAFDDPEDCDKFFESDFEMRVQKKALKILDNDHAKANLPKMVKECQHLSTDEKHSLLKLFQQHEDLFEGKVGTWNWAPVSLESKEGAKPWCGRVHTLPVACTTQT